MLHVGVFSGAKGQGVGFSWEKTLERGGERERALRLLPGGLEDHVPF